MQEIYAMLRHKFGTYWNQTETYEALKIYIQMDMDGLQDAVVRMLAGEAIKINTGTFSNDMTTFASKDDVLTLLVHLGYLTYNSIDESVTIPNKEVSQEYVNALTLLPLAYDDFFAAAKSAMKPRHRTMLHKLLDFHFDRRATRYNLPPNRLKMIEKEVQRRARVLLG